MKFLIIIPIIILGGLACELFGVVMMMATDKPFGVWSKVAVYGAMATLGGVGVVLIGGLTIAIISVLSQ